jgi:hypothetical protein
MLARLVGSEWSASEEKVEVTAFFALPIALETAVPIVFTWPVIPFPALVNVDAIPLLGCSAMLFAGFLANQVVGDFMLAQPEETANVDKPSTRARRTLSEDRFVIITRELLMVRSHLFSC